MALALGSAYVTTMWPIDPPPQWVDRSQELATLRVGVEALRHGGGAAVWVEGEPGIGKSSLVVEALAGAGEPRWDIGWGMADQLAERLPLSVMRDCLQVRLGSPDPRRAHAAELLRSQRLGLFADGDASVSSCEVLIALADELCAAAPTVMVIDDLQWADHASLLVWHQLAASIDQLRLLLIATCRPAPRRPEMQQVRASLARRGGAVVELGPLPETDVAALVIPGGAVPDRSGGKPDPRGGGPGTAAASVRIAALPARRARGGRRFAPAGRSQSCRCRGGLDRGTAGPGVLADPAAPGRCRPRLADRQG